MPCSAENTVLVQFLKLNISGICYLRLCRNDNLVYIYTPPWTCWCFTGETFLHLKLWKNYNHPHLACRQPNQSQSSPALMWRNISVAKELLFKTFTENSTYIYLTRDYETRKANKLNWIECTLTNALAPWHNKNDDTMKIGMISYLKIS